MEPLSLLVLGIAISGTGIYLTIKHPLKWKILGVSMAISGIAINVVNGFTVS